jgi:hypothetical protein
MVAARRPEHAGAGPAAKRVPTLILAIETKCILLVDRPGAPTTALAPALRVGFIASAVTLDEHGDVRGALTAPITVDPGAATHQLASLAATQMAMREVDVVGLIGDDDGAAIVRGALHQLRARGECDAWTEVLDPALLRSRLARALEVLERSEVVRDEILGSWDHALAFEPGAIDEVIGALRRRATRVDAVHATAALALVEFLDRHRARADYGTLRRERGLEIPAPVRKHLHEHLPLRLHRSRCRPITSW